MKTLGIRTHDKKLSEVDERGKNVFYKEKVMIISVPISVGHSRRWCWTEIEGVGISPCLMFAHLPIPI